MAQVFVPENPREREQLQGGVGVSDREQRPQRKSYPSRRFGTIDLVVILAIVAAISLLVLAAARWATPLTPAVTINLSPSALPAYAWYSLLRMFWATCLLSYLR
jgi:NitT/TauT family transport system permease protein